MLDDEWLEHGPASINLLIERQAERDKLADYRAGIIAAVWVKDATPGTWFAALKADEDRQRTLEKVEHVKATIANAKRKSKLEGRWSKGVRRETPKSSGSG